MSSPAPKAAYAVLCILYLGVMGLRPFPADWLLKALPILLLGAYAAKVGRGRVRGILIAALAMSALGDVLLALDGLFLPGLGAFLVAQLCYAGLFFSQAERSPRGWMWAIGVVMLVASVGAGILPLAGEMALPVGGYMLAISTMAIGAGFRRDPEFWWVGLGALVFVASDSLIAVNTFVQPFGLADLAVMVTYYVAQGLMVFGVLRSEGLSGPQS